MKKNKGIIIALIALVLVIIAVVIRYNFSDEEANLLEEADRGQEEGLDESEDIAVIELEDILLTEPALNNEQDMALFKASNLSEYDFDGMVYIESYENDEISETKEHTILIKAGQEDEQIRLPGKKGDIISMNDKEGKTYMEPYELGSREWVATWASAQQGLNSSQGEYPPAPGLANNTFRQIVRISVGGDQLRFKFSNEYGNTPLELNSVHISRPYDMGASVIFPKLDTIVTFNGGEESVSIAPGQVVTSDLIDYNAGDLERIAISTHFSSVPDIVTSHTGARTTSFLKEGNHVSEIGLNDAVEREHWYFITGIDVLASPKHKAIACLGDSTTDGRGVRTNFDDRWTDILAERLVANESTKHVSVLNQGIGGNSIFGGLGPAAYKRFDRDVLEQEGVAYAIVFEGINDIGYASSPSLVDSIIEKYIEFAEKAHEQGLKIYGATITPFQGFDSYYTEEHGEMREQIRQDINAWIRDNDYFDGVIDFDEALRDKDNPSFLAREYSSDGLHPNVPGYQKMGEIIDLSLFED